MSYTNAVISMISLQSSNVSIYYLIISRSFLPSWICLYHLGVTCSPTAFIKRNLRPKPQDATSPHFQSGQKMKNTSEIGSQR